MNDTGKYYVEWDPIEGLWNVKDSSNNEKILASYITYKSARDFIQEIYKKEDEG